jgi:hypothetical protein
MLGELLLTDQDFSGQWMDVYLNGDTFPLTADHRDYSAPPDEICPDGGSIDPVGTGSVYASTTGHDAWVGRSEWIAGEPPAMAIDRFEATSKAIDNSVTAFSESTAESGTSRGDACGAARRGKWAAGGCRRPST